MIKIDNKNFFFTIFIISSLLAVSDPRKFLWGYYDLKNRIRLGVFRAIRKYIIFFLGVGGWQDIAKPIVPIRPIFFFFFNNFFYILGIQLVRGLSENI